MNGEYLKISNIGRIKQANIKLDGLSIIAGKNDTGKSTIGKLVFSIVKAISRYKYDFQNDKEKELIRLIELLYIKFKRDLKDYDTDIIKNIQDAFYPPNFIDELELFFIENEIKIKLIKDILEEKKQLIKKIVEEEKQYQYLSVIDKIDSLVTQKESLNEQVIEALDKAFISEFYSELSPKTKGQKNGVLNYQSNNKTFDVFIQNDEVQRIVLNDIGILENELLFDDVTYIESPMYLQLSNLIDNAETLFDFDMDNERKLVKNTPKVSLHIKDLINKLKQSQYFRNDLFGIIENQEGLLHQINKIIEGEFVYDRKKSEFEFKNKDKNTLKTINTASGVKSFGILQLLLQSNTLDERSLLIIDEPENHLHPQWQVKYADIITELVKNNISVLINSHSPYMIQALNYFSKEKGIENNAEYYLTETVEKSGMVKFNNVSDDIDLVFRTLAEPINKIMW